MNNNINGSFVIMAANASIKIEQNVNTNLCGSLVLGLRGYNNIILNNPKVLDLVGISSVWWLSLTSDPLGGWQ